MFGVDPGEKALTVSGAALSLNFLKRMCKIASVAVWCFKGSDF